MVKITFKTYINEDNHNLYIYENGQEVGMLHMQEETIETFHEDLDFLKDSLDKEEINQIEAVKEKTEDFTYAVNFTHFQINEGKRGNGYGTQLFEYAIEHANDYFGEDSFKHLNASPSYGYPLNYITDIYKKYSFEIYLEQGGNALMINLD